VDVFMAQQIPHHPAARKRVIEVNLVDAAHQAEIGIAN
jgi:putative NIF3 family GTP cyclohydrolase 1 type 2